MKKLINSVVIGLFLFTSSLNAQCLNGNCFNGKGTYMSDLVIVYTGYFEQGMKSGKGIEINLEEVTILYSNWENGLPQGKSIFVFQDGSKLYCTFEFGELHGKSRLVDERNNLSGYFYWYYNELINYELSPFYKEEQINFSPSM